MINGLVLSVILYIQCLYGYTVLFVINSLVIKAVANKMRLFVRLRRF